MRPMGDGHYYEPTLFQGGYIRWLTPSGDGMFGKVLELIPNEKITFEHHGWISNGIDSQEDTFNSLEKYTLSASSDGTMVTIDVETFPEYEKLMMEKYPLVLAELNKIAAAAFLSQNENHWIFWFWFPYIRFLRNFLWNQIKFHLEFNRWKITNDHTIIAF